MRYALFVLWLVGLVARAVVALGLIVAAFAAMVWQVVALNDLTVHKFLADIVDSGAAPHFVGLVLFFLPGILAVLCAVSAVVIIRSIERGGRRTPPRL